jgi:hypothetical protein
MCVAPQPDNAKNRHLIAKRFLPLILVRTQRWVRILQKRTGLQQAFSVNFGDTFVLDGPRLRRDPRAFRHSGSPARVARRDINGSVIACNR